MTRTLTGLARMKLAPQSRAAAMLARLVWPLMTITGVKQLGSVAFRRSQVTNSKPVVSPSTSLISTRLTSRLVRIS